MSAAQRAAVIAACWRAYGERQGEAGAQKSHLVTLRRNGLAYHAE
jgi:hypothetical protein